MFLTVVCCHNHDGLIILNTVYRHKLLRSRSQKADLFPASDNRGQDSHSSETLEQRTCLATWDQGLQLNRNLPPLPLLSDGGNRSNFRNVVFGKTTTDSIQNNYHGFERICLSHQPTLPTESSGRQCSETIEMSLREQRASNKDSRKIKRSHSLRH
jgi:hypothetical protein